VYDTGSGVSSEKQKTLFRAFRHQIGDGIKDRRVDATSGVGIGLTNSKVLAKSLGGSISLKSRVAIFTEVTVIVNAARKPPKPQASESV